MGNDTALYYRLLNAINAKVNASVEIFKNNAPLIVKKIKLLYNTSSGSFFNAKIKYLVGFFILNA